MLNSDAMSKELKGLYSKAITQSDLEKVWGIGKGFAMNVPRERWLEIGVYSVILPALWARYYLAKQFGKTEEDILNFYTWVEDGWISSKSAGEVDLLFSYGYLISVVKSQLLKKLTDADAINSEMDELLKYLKDAKAAFNVINAEALAADQRGEFQEAINILDRAEKLFPEARKNPATFQSLANIYSNMGLSEIKLSDAVESLDFKREYLYSALLNLNEACELYMKVVPPSLKHIIGVENRLILAVSKILLTSGLGDEAGLGKRIGELFAANAKDDAKEIISGITRADIFSGEMDKFIESVQVEFGIIGDFLAKNGV